MHSKHYSLLYCIVLLVWIGVMFLLCCYNYNYNIVSISIQSAHTSTHGQVLCVIASVFRGFFDQLQGAVKLKGTNTSVYIIIIIINNVPHQSRLLSCALRCYLMVGPSTKAISNNTREFVE